MSGSGGGGGGGFAPPDTCEANVIDTQLSSPKPAVLAGIHVHDKLDVTVQAGSGVESVVVLFNGEVAGGLASPEVRSLRECILRGTKYYAEVTDKNEGQVKVRVRAK